MVFISSWRRTHSHVDSLKRVCKTHFNFSSKIANLLCSNPFFPTGVSTVVQEKQMLPAETERADAKLVEMVVSIKRIGQ